MAGPLTQAAQTAHSFADISYLLRECVADEELRLLRDNISALAKSLDLAVGARRHRRDASTIARRAAALAQELRQHQAALSGPEAGWTTMYEWINYQRALRELTQAVQRWRETLAQRSSNEGAAFDQMEQWAWRALGEGLLLLDMYQQGVGLLMPSNPEAPTSSPRSSWWKNLLRRWSRWH